MAWEAELKGAQRDAYAAILQLLKGYGLEALAPRVLDFVRQDYSQDTISVLLQETPEYKQRFSANEARKKKGLPVLSPAEYVATEKAYRDVMANAGLPIGFYDSPSDFTQWLELDVSPTEVKQRVDVAASAVYGADKATLDYFRGWYSDGDMIAYMLDQKRAVPIIEQQFRSATIAGAARNQGVTGLSRSTIEELGRTTSLTAEQAQQGLGFVAAEQGTASKLGQIYGSEIDAEDLVQEVFKGDAGATQKRRKLASKERASFSGSGGQSQSSLSKSDAGQS